MTPPDSLRLWAYNLVLEGHQRRNLNCLISAVLEARIQGMNDTKHSSSQELRNTLERLRNEYNSRET